MADAIALAEELFNLRSQIEGLKVQADEVETQLLAEMSKGGILEVPGIGVFQARKRKDRKAWRHQEIQSALIARIRSGECRLADPETGELEDDIAMTARAFIATANPAWRTTVLPAWNIDADEFCEVLPGPWTIQLHGELQKGEAV